MTLFEIRMLRCIREYRRLCNQTINDIRETDACHKEADSILAVEPDLDNPAEHFDAPHRVEHRQFIAKVFRRR